MAAEKKQYITALGVLSSLCVVLLHTSSFWEFQKTRGWVAGNLVESVCYFAVPVFIMISGATLIDYRERCTTAEYFKRRIRKTLLPFIFWSLFAAAWSALFLSVEVDWRPTALINAVINCKYMGIYYFFLIIFGVYASIPLFGYIPKESRKSAFGYLTVAGVTVNSLLPFICRLTFGRIEHNYNFTVEACGGLLIYAIIGYCLSHYEIPRRGRLIIYFLGISGLLLHFFGTWYFSWRDDAINDIFKGYGNIPCLLYSSAVFLFVKQIPFEKLSGFITKALMLFGGQTFGIYLIHMYIITASNRFGLSPESVYARTAFAILIFVLSGLLVKLAQRIPIIKHLVP